MGVFIIIGLEFVLTLAIVVAWFNEDKLMTFENQIIARIKKGG